MSDVCVSQQVFCQQFPILPHAAQRLDFMEKKMNFLLICAHVTTSHLVGKAVSQCNVFD